MELSNTSLTDFYHLRYDVLRTGFPKGHPWITWLNNWSYLVLSLHLVSLMITVIHSERSCFHQPPMRIAVSIPPDEVAGIPHTSLSAEVEIIPCYIKIQ